MTRLIWDAIGDRRFELGLDRGVLYLSDGSGIPWNGLVSVEEETPDKTTPLYVDGTKYLDLAATEDYAANISALTYPDEFMQFNGDVTVIDGMSVDGQVVTERFSLSYRTLVGNDTDGSDFGYKIHIVYNLLATQDSLDYMSDSDVLNPTEFRWNITAVPVSLDGFKPTAHIVFDSTVLHPLFMADLEDILYGKSDVDARLPSISELSEFAIAWGIIVITDNGDGTWTAEGPDDRITMTDPTTFQITQIDATYIDADTYVITNTRN